MLTQVNEILNQAMARIAAGIAAFLPGLLAMAVVLALAVVVGWIAERLLRRSLRSVDFDKRVEQWGLSGVSEWSPGQSPSRLLGATVYWLIVLLGLLVGISALNASVTSMLVVRILNYLPSLFAAAAVLVLGFVFARFISRTVLISAVNMQIQSARLLSLGVKWLVMLMAGAMALEHIGIGGGIVRLGFGILFGGIVLAMALAVGLGSKEMVSRSLERQAGKNAEEAEASARLHHL